METHVTFVAVKRVNKKNSKYCYGKNEFDFFNWNFQLNEKIVFGGRGFTEGSKLV